MIINNAINSPLPTSLAKGGMGASLTASDGGIFYSTASTAAILPGTSRDNRGLLSGSSIIPTMPEWSTVTYPIISHVGDLFYSQVGNAIQSLSIANSASLASNSLNAPSWQQPMISGQVMIGSTSGTPTVANLTAGANVTIANSYGSITVNQAPNWHFITSQTASHSAFLGFNFDFTSSYIAYRLVIINILPSIGEKALFLNFGTGLGPGPNYISSGYIYQLCDINDNGLSNTYPGYTGSDFGAALLSFNNGISSSPTFGGICGTIDLYVTAGSSNVANGISHMSYMTINQSVHYANDTCAFQIPAANYYSVQVYTGGIGNMVSGTVYLYGLTT